LETVSLEIFQTNPNTDLQKLNCLWMTWVTGS